MLAELKFPDKLGYGFILSTGRTATLFLKEYINLTSKKGYCSHEPKPSHIFIPLTNKLYQGKISPEDYTKLYLAARKDLFDVMNDENYIESNNFIWAGISAFNNYIDDIKVLHIIRHPQDYIISHYDHGFWKGKKKWIRKYMPYFQSDDNLTKEERNNPFLFLAKRWKVINEKLDSYADSNKYLRIRYEDIFSVEKEMSLDCLKKIRIFFELGDIDEAEQALWLNRVVNKSDKRTSLTEINQYQDFIKKELGTLMDEYGYALK